MLSLTCRIRSRISSLTRGGLSELDAGAREWVPDTRDWWIGGSRVDSLCDDEVSRLRKGEGGSLSRHFCLSLARSKSRGIGIPRTMSSTAEMTKTPQLCSSLCLKSSFKDQPA